MEPLGGATLRIKALMEAADAVPGVGAVAPVNLVTVVPATLAPLELQSRLGTLFGYEVRAFFGVVGATSLLSGAQVEITAYEDDERDRITVVEPARDVLEAYRVQATPLKMWVRAVGPLPDAALVMSGDVAAPAADDSYWNDRDVGGSADILSLQAILPYQQVVQRVRPRSSSVSSQGIRFERTEKILGKGAFGIVFQGVRDDGSIIAVKEMSLAREERDPAALRKLLEIDKEISLLQKLDHVHIVRYLGSVRTADAICICLEYADGGTLLQHIQRVGPAGLPELAVKNFTRQILLGLNYLHSQNVVHRDVKSANILLHDAGKLLKVREAGEASPS